MLKLYIQERGWQGMVLAIAKSEEDARKIMANECNYSDKRPVEEYEIKDGFVYSCAGDL